MVRPRMLASLGGLPSLPDQPSCKSRCDGHLVLGRRIESPRFLRIDTFSARNVVHMFRLSRPSDVDEEFRAWLAEAYPVETQQHLLQ